MPLAQRATILWDGDKWKSVRPQCPGTPFHHHHYSGSLSSSSSSLTRYRESSCLRVEISNIDFGPAPFRPCSLFCSSGMRFAPNGFDNRKCQLNIPFYSSLSCSVGWPARVRASVKIQFSFRAYCNCTS